MRSIYLHWYKHQCYCVWDYILQIFFSSYRISLSLNQSFVKKSEEFRSVHHVIFILCYNMLSDFFALVFSLIRVSKHWWDDITQGKQYGKAHLRQIQCFQGFTVNLITKYNSYYNITIRRNLRW